MPILSNTSIGSSVCHARLENSRFERSGSPRGRSDPRQRTQRQDGTHDAHPQPYLVPNRAHGCPAAVGEAAISHRGEPVARDLARIGPGPLGGRRGRAPRLRGLKTPTDKNPTRVVLAEEEYQALLRVSREVDWRFHVALVLAHETGHRIGAIRRLRWSDIGFEGGAILWRAEHDKSGYEHITPVTSEALVALKAARAVNPGTGEAPVLPAPRNPSACMGAALAQGWWDRAERLAGLEPKPGRGWHSLRRKFASDLMDQPLKVLCALGGWKTAKTVLECYQRPDAGQLRKALEARRRSPA